MDVKLEQYRIFYRVAVNKSFTAGAEELFLTQSAVSQSVKALEEAVGAALFIRGKRGVELTQEGRILFEYVGSALSLIEQGQAELGKVKTLDGGELRIGVGDTVSRYLLLPSLERFSRMHPKVELKIFNRVSRETIELLRHGQIDIAMVNMPIDPTGVHLAGEVPVQDCFVAGVDFARRLEGTRLTYEEIARLPLILLDSRSSSRRFIDARFGERGIVLHPEIELGSHDLLLDFTAANLGAACVVEEFSGRELGSGRVVRLDTEPIPKRSVGIFTLRESRPPAAGALLELLGF